MATNTLIQKLDSDGNVSVATSHRSQYETFIASETIAANDLVAVDFGKSSDADKALYVVQADSGSATDKCAVGFAVNGGAAGALIKVTVSGIHESANVDGSTVQGSRLIVGSTAGRAGLAADINEGGASVVAQFPIIAIACEADATNVATVFVLKQF